MGVLERYKGLVSAAQRYSVGAGVKLSLEAVPDERHFPIVFHLDPISGHTAANSPKSLLFLFFPGETMLTSEVLNEVINRLNADAPTPVLLFAADDLRLVRRALEVSGLSKHAAIHSYRFHAGLFECDWIPAVLPVEPQLVAT